AEFDACQTLDGLPKVDLRIRVIDEPAPSAPGTEAEPHPGVDVLEAREAELGFRHVGRFAVRRDDQPRGGSGKNEPRGTPVAFSPVDHPVRHPRTCRPFSDAGSHGAAAVTSRGRSLRDRTDVGRRLPDRGADSFGATRGITRRVWP